MAILSDTTYNRLSKNAETSYLILLNEDAETVKTGKLVTLKKTKGHIKIRWESMESYNNSPLTYAALIINGRSTMISSIKPIERTLSGWLDIEYEYAHYS